MYRFLCIYPHYSRHRSPAWGWGWGFTTWQRLPPFHQLMGLTSHVDVASPSQSYPSLIGRFSVLVTHLEYHDHPPLPPLGPLPPSSSITSTPSKPNPCPVKYSTYESLAAAHLWSCVCKARDLSSQPMTTTCLSCIWACVVWSVRG